MAMECPACGGHLVFKPETQSLECPYCDSVFDAKKYNLNNEAEKQKVVEEKHGKTFLVDVYTCKNCGAELCAPKEQIVSFCMYCGGQATLLQKSSPIQRPKGVIPFKLSKEDVRKIYTSRLKAIPFVPRSLKKAEFLEGFRGIYIPYWITESTLSGMTAELEGQITTVHSSYDLEEFFNYRAEFNGIVDTGTYDASEAFDDTIAAAISPYHKSLIVPFKESYLSGFYADKPTVEIETYEGVIENKYAESIKKEIKEQVDKMETSSQNIKKNLPLDYVKGKSVLFPVWFLTWRKKNRVSYSVMNGENGTLSIDAPVDYVKFFFVTILLAAVLAGLMCLMPTFVIPFRVATISSALLYISSYIYKSELKKINQIENHVFDIGSTLHKKINVDEIKKIAGKKGCWLSAANTLQYILLLGAMITGYEASSIGDVQSVFFGMIVFQVILFIKQLKLLKGVKCKAGMFTMILSVVVQIAGFCVALNDAPEDIYYYGIAIACMSAMIINIVTSIFYVNYLATRPVPNFYTREGANNGR